MTNHNMAPTFGGESEKKRPWFRKPITYAIGVPVLAVVVLVNALNPAADGGREATRGESLKATVTEAPAEKEVVEAVVEEEPEPVAEEIPEVDMEQVGLFTLRDLHPNFALVGDQVIIDAAQAACIAFDEGASFQTYILIAVGEGLSAEEAGALAGFAVNAYCPEYLDIAEGY